MFKTVAAIYVSSLSACLMIVWLLPFQECPAGQLCAPFKHIKVSAYYVPLIFAGMKPDQTGNMISTLEVYEDGVRLGPPHSDVGEIEMKGRGRFIYWQSSMNNDIYFSASDNSDPNTNGRTYTVVAKRL